MERIRIFFTGHRHVVIAMTVILAVGFFLRIWGLGEQSLWIDEGYTLNAAQATLKHGYPLMDSGEVYGNSHLYVYITAGVIKFAGLDPLNPWVVRLPSVFLGIGVIIVSFLFTRILFRSNGLALLVATLLALSYWEIDWSRQVRGYTGLQFFILGALSYLYRWLESKHVRHLFLGGALFVLAYLHHKLAIVFMPAMVAAILVYYVLHASNRFPRRHIFVGIFSLAMLVVFTVLTGFVDLQRIAYDYSWFYLSFLLGAFIPITYATLAGIGLSAFDQKRFWPVVFVAINILVPLVIIMFFGQMANLRYLFPLFPLATILSVYAISRAVSFLPNIRGPQAWVGIGMLCIILFSGQITFIPRSFYQFEFDSPRPDFESAYLLIAERRQEGDIVLSPYAHLTNIYLGETGYWLPIILSGNPRKLDLHLIDGAYDRYVRAPAVLGTEHLNRLIEENNGFVVVDGMSKSRLKELLPSIIDHPKTSDIFRSGKGLNEITVYRF